jgi:pimeloyl-ACP methyl ester carboxylesterase
VGPRALLRAAVGALAAVAVVVAPASAVTRVPGEPSSRTLLRQHYVRASGGATAVPRARAAPAARQAATLVPCEEAGPDGQCGTVAVPLDRADPSRGTVPIFFLYYRHRDPGPANEAILVTGGGPGFSVTSIPPIVDYHRDVFDSLLDTRDLIFLDQRGVGGSDAIDCPQIQHGSEDPFHDIAACGAQLGSSASLYSTADVAQDIDAVRAALGIDKLDFYGGSYAGLDIQAYATRFPQHLRSAVLDSPVVFGSYDFDAPTVRAINRTVRLICARSPTCRADQDNALDEVARLARRLREQPLEGVGFDALGERREVRLTEGTLLWRILTSDAGFYVAASEVAAAADALRHGDPVPLLRLAAEGDGPLIVDEGEPREFSLGHNNARFCTDAPMPWDKAASGPERLRQWRAARDALSADAFAPYSVDAWLSPAPIGPLGPDLCIGRRRVSGHRPRADPQRRPRLEHAHVQSSPTGPLVAQQQLRRAVGLRPSDPGRRAGPVRRVPRRPLHRNARGRAGRVRRRPAVPRARGGALPADGGRRPGGAARARGPLHDARPQGRDGRHGGGDRHLPARHPGAGTGLRRRPARRHVQPGPQRRAERRPGQAHRRALRRRRGGQR